MQTVTLNNGVEMPILGFGVFQIPPAECAKAVLNAFEAGYCMIDTAQAYYNEEGVGEALEASGLPREDVFLVTKVWISNAGEEKAAKSIEASLDKLRTDYIDLLLIHQPFGDYPGTWRAMEKALADGKVRAIGLSNFYPDRFVDMAECATVKPAVNQLKTNVFRQQWDADHGLGAACAGKSRARQVPASLRRSVQSRTTTLSSSAFHLSHIAPIGFRAPSGFFVRGGFVG